MNAKKNTDPITWRMTGSEVRYVRAAALAASKYDGRPVLQQVHVRIAKGAAMVEATDSYRMHRVEWVDDHAPDLDTLIPVAWFVKHGPKKMAIGETLDLTIGDRLSMECDGDGYSTPRVRSDFPDTDALWKQFDAKPTGPDDLLTGLDVRYLADVYKAAQLVNGGTLPNFGIRKIDVMSPLVFEQRDAAIFRAAIMPIRLTWSDDKAAAA